MKFSLEGVIFSRVFDYRPTLVNLEFCLLIQMAIKKNGFIPSSAPEELKKVLKTVASEWGDLIQDMEEFHVIPLKGAMTNEVFQINWPTKHGDLHQKVLVRIYGEGVEVFFNRDDEIRTFECISKHGHGPKLLGRFPDGRIEEFIHARVCEIFCENFFFIFMMSNFCNTPGCRTFFF